MQAKTCPVLTQISKKCRQFSLVWRLSLVNYCFKFSLPKLNLLSIHTDSCDNELHIFEKNVQRNSGQTSTVAANSVVCLCLTLLQISCVQRKVGQWVFLFTTAGLSNPIHSFTDMLMSFGPLLWLPVFSILHSIRPTYTAPTATNLFITTTVEPSH